MNFKYPDDYTLRNAHSDNPEVLSWILKQGKDDTTSEICCPQ